MNSVWGLPIFLLAGYFAQRFFSEKRCIRLADRLNRFVIYVSLPSLVFVYMIDITPEGRFLIPVASAWGLFFFSAILILMLARRLAWSRPLTGALLMTVPYGNTSFLGIPFTRAFFGEAGVPYAIVYDQLGSFLILSTLGILTLSLYTARQTTVGHIVRRIVTFPAFIALVLALLVDPAGPPSWLLSGLRGLAATLTPAALLAIGLHLQLRLEPGRKLPFALGLMIKLLLAPLILYLLFGWLDLHNLAAKVSIFEAAMGPMISSAMLAMMAGLEQRFVASLLGYGIVLSFVTLPGVYWVLAG